MAKATMSTTDAIAEAQQKLADAEKQLTAAKAAADERYAQLLAGENVPADAFATVQHDVERRTLLRDGAAQRLADAHEAARLERVS